MVGFVNYWMKQDKALQKKDNIGCASNAHCIFSILKFSCLLHNYVYQLKKTKFYFNTMINIEIIILVLVEYLTGLKCILSYGKAEYPHFNLLY